MRKCSINVNFLITLTVTRHIERSPVNRLKIGISAMLYEKNKGVRPIAMISEPTNTGWTVAPNCFAACLTELYAQHAKSPARSIGKKLIKALHYATSRSTHLRINPKRWNNGGLLKDMELTRAQHNVRKFTVGYNNIDRSIICAFGETYPSKASWSKTWNALSPVFRPPHLRIRSFYGDR